LIRAAASTLTFGCFDVLLEKTGNGSSPLLKSLRLGCLLAFGFVCITAAVGAVLVSLFVPGAWRGRPFGTTPLDIALVVAAVVGFGLGFLGGIRRERSAGKTNKGP
jgi:hypothetical protein